MFTEFQVCNAKCKHHLALLAQVASGTRNLSCHAEMQGSRKQDATLATVKDANKPKGLPGKPTTKPLAEVLENVLVPRAVSRHVVTSFVHDNQCASSHVTISAHLMICIHFAAKLC